MTTHTSATTFDLNINPTYAIRAMTADDIEWYTQLQIDEHGSFFSSRRGSFVSHDSFVSSVKARGDTLKSRLTEDQNTYAWVATIEDRPVGAAVFQFSGAKSAMQEYHLDSTSKLSGVGTKLLLTGVEEVKRRDVQIVTADCYTVDGAKIAALRGACFESSDDVRFVRLHGKAMCVQNWEKRLDGMSKVSSANRDVPDLAL